VPFSCFTISIELQHAFKLYDTDKNGTINADEFKQVLNDLGKRDITEDQVKDMLASVDRNNDKVIQWEEFLDVILFALIGCSCSKVSKLATRIFSNRFSRLSQVKRYLKQ
jgi:hypothetical protein